jgi:hypothetical protein
MLCPCQVFANLEALCEDLLCGESVVLREKGASRRTLRVQWLGLVWGVAFDLTGVSLLGYGS